MVFYVKFMVFFIVRYGFYGGGKVMKLYIGEGFWKVAFFDIIFFFSLIGFEACFFL